MGLAQFGNWPPGAKLAGEALIANVGGILFQKGNMLLSAVHSGTGVYQLNLDPTQLDVATNPVNRLTVAATVGGGGAAISATALPTGATQITITIVNAAGAAVDGGFYVQIFG